MKEMLRRSLRTFFQAAIGYIAANVAGAIAGGGEWDVVKTALIGLGVSSVAAGLAAVMNIPNSNGESGENNG